MKKILASSCSTETMGIFLAAGIVRQFTRRAVQPSPDYDTGGGPLAQQQARSARLTQRLVESLIQLKGVACLPGGREGFLS
jgi:hypothetical protein